MENIRQLSVFIENKSGRIRKIMEILAENNIDIRALSIAETTDYGVLRMIVREPDVTYDILKTANITASLTPVIAVEVSDKPGALVGIMGALERDEIGVEYMYAFLNKTPGTAIMILRTEQTEKAIEVLKQANVKLVAEANLF